LQPNDKGEIMNNDGNKIIGYIFALVVAIGFAIVLAQAVVLTLLILALFFFALALLLKSDYLLYISIILFIATFVAFIVGFVFGGTEFGRMAVKIFNVTINPTQSLPIFPK
jgi:hypothetical protein